MPNPAARGSGRLRGKGKRVREARGADSRPQLGRGGPRAVWPRRRAAAAADRRPRGVAAAMEVGKAPGDSVESITPLTLGRGDAQRRGDGKGAAAASGAWRGGAAGLGEGSSGRWARLWSSGVPFGPFL